jgi:hypothetical protein
MRLRREARVEQRLACGVRHALRERSQGVMSKTTIHDFRFLPVEEAISPANSGYFQHITNAWWTAHPDLGLAFYHRRTQWGLGTPQCNTDENIARKLAERINYDWPHLMVFLESVWVPIDVRELRGGS